MAIENLRYASYSPLFSVYYRPKFSNIGSQMAGNWNFEVGF